MAAIRGADCHAHVYDGARHPYAADASYVPPPCQAGTTEEFLAVLDAHKLAYGLIVETSVFGPGNACLLDALARSANRCKGIALIEHNVTEKEIVRLSAGGVVGIRLNLYHEGLTPLTHPAAPRLLATIKDAGWFCQIQTGKDYLVRALPILKQSGVRVMIDHCGRPDLDGGVVQPGFQALLELGRSGNAVIKLSAPFRFSKLPFPYSDTDPFYYAVMEAFGIENCVWGSDWPFVKMEARVDYGPTLACLERWLPDESDQRKVLRENPMRFFGFGS